MRPPGSDALGLRWHSCSVMGRHASYGAAGQGPTLLFLHGWGLGYRAYSECLEHLVDLGFRVLAPGLPGLSGTYDLPGGQRSLGGYAAWVDAFLDAAGVTDPVTVVGHSFGGGVAIKTAYDFSERVRALVLVNSIGGSAWTKGHGVVRTLAERPLWDWGLHFPADLMPMRQVRKVVPVILRDAVPNLLHNPKGIMRVAAVARAANLEPELAELGRRELPMAILWGRDDRVLPQLSMRALSVASGSDVISVPGGHCWLLADPRSFGEVMTNVVAATADMQVRTVVTDGMIPRQTRRRPRVPIQNKTQIEDDSSAAS